MVIMTDQFDTHNLYYVNISNNTLVTIPLIYVITATIFLLPTNFII